MRSKERADASKRKIEEAVACIRAREESETDNLDRAEAEARSRAEAKISGKAEKVMDAAEAKTKRDAKAVERARAWSEAESKEKTEITRVADQDGKKAKA